MPKPQLLYGAFDTGPSNYGLDIITHAQRKLNWGVAYLGNNPAVDVKAVRQLAFDHIIVGGPSSFENDLDKELLNLTWNQKNRSQENQVYVLGDSPRSILRPGIKEYIRQVIALVASPSDIECAREFGYKDAVWLGYPSHWNVDPTQIKPSTFYECYSAGLRIFVCGLKHAGITDNMLASVIGAMKNKDGKIYFQAHPSEIEATKNTECRIALLQYPNVIEFKSRENVASVMMACDLTVCTGGATGIIEGALLRLPVVYYMDEQVMAYMKKASNDEIFGPVAAGACEIATADTMTSVISMLLDDPCAQAKLREAQEVAFPLQSKGMNTVHEVLTYIQDPAGYVPFDQRQKK